MKKAFLFLLMMAVCGVAWGQEKEVGVELLIQAKPHWMDSLTEKEVALMDESTRQSYEARSSIGDVIAVRPAGWAWGKEEGLPNYVVVKVPITLEEAKKYEEQLVENVQYESVVDGKSETITTQVLKRRRKYAIPDAYVSSAKVAERTDVSIASKDVATFKSTIVEKVGLATEIKPAVKDTIRTDLQSFYKSYLHKYVSIARTFWIENAWAATQLKKTVCPSGCDYTALETCMNANEQNLVTADKYFDVEISGDWSSDDTTAVTLHNYTTDSTRYINIYAVGDATHGGGASSGYTLYSSSGTAFAIEQSNINLKMDGWIVKHNTSSWGGGIRCYNQTGINVTLSNFIVYNRTTTVGTSPSGIRNEASDGTWKIKNVLVYDFYSDGHGMLFTSKVWGLLNVYLYNVTIDNCKQGVVINTTGGGSENYDMHCYAKNVLITNGVSGGFYGGNYRTGTTNNASYDTTTPELGTYYDSVSIDYVDRTNKNFSLASTDTDAIDHGTDLSSDANYSFSDDISGTTRSGTWDIGADEYVGTAARRFFIIQ